MPAYRLYFMDGLSGHIVHTQVFAADDDVHAIAKASGLQGRTTMELWCQSRKVHHWEANPTYSICV